MTEEKDETVQVATRVTTRSIKVPFEEGTEEREELIRKIIENHKEVSRLENEIKPLKDLMKASQTEIESAESLLSFGHYVDTEIEQTLNYETNMLYETVVSTGEQITARAMTEDDLQGDAFDTPSGETPTPEEVEDVAGASDLGEGESQDD